MANVRAFAAIDLAEELKAELRAVQRELQDAETRRVVRWVPAENMHLTVKFLGQVDATRIPDLAVALQNSISGIPPFTLTVRGLGCFPDTRRPNVVWAGLNGHAFRAVELARRVEDTFYAHGFPREARPFSPHLTLGRISREAPPAGRAAIGKRVLEFPVRDLGVILADAVHLIRSDLSPGRPVYTTLATAHLHDSLSQPP